MSRGKSLATDVWVRPKPEVVARLVDGYGLPAACERWAWCEKRTLLNLAAEGRRMLGLEAAARGVGSRARTAPDREAAALDAVVRLKSVPAAATETGLDPSVIRRILRDRDLPIPRVDRSAAARKAAQERRRRAA